MTYPSTFTAFVYPQPTQTLNSPSHSGLHTTEASAIGQLETVIGRSGDSSVLGTVITDLRSPGSFGGGHVQTGAYGGTGQTFFTKGDILVASSASALSRLAVGSDGQTILADSSTASGIKWSNVANNKVYVRSSYLTAFTTETSVYSQTLPASTLGSSASPNAVRATAYVQNWQTRSGGGGVTFSAQYGGVPVASVILTPQGNDTVMVGTITHIIFASTATLQKHLLDVNFTSAEVSTDTAGSMENVFFRTVADTTAHPSIITVRGYSSTLSSINSSMDNTLGMTITTASNNTVAVGGIIIEKIN